MLPRYNYMLLHLLHAHVTITLLYFVHYLCMLPHATLLFFVKSNTAEKRLRMRQFY